MYFILVRLVGVQKVIQTIINNLLLFFYINPAMWKFTIKLLTFLKLRKYFQKTLSAFTDNSYT